MVALALALATKDAELGELSPWPRTIHPPREKRSIRPNTAQVPAQSRVALGQVQDDFGGLRSPTGEEQVKVHPKRINQSAWQGWDPGVGQMKATWRKGLTRLWNNVI